MLRQIERPLHFRQTQIDRYTCWILDLWIFGFWIFDFWILFQLSQSVEITYHIDGSGCFIGQHNPETFLLTRSNSFLLAYPPTLPKCRSPCVLHPIQQQKRHLTRVSSPPPIAPADEPLAYSYYCTWVKRTLLTTCTAFHHTARSSQVAPSLCTNSSLFRSTDFSLYQRAGAIVFAGALEGIDGPLQRRGTAAFAPLGIHSSFLHSDTTGLLHH